MSRIVIISGSPTSVTRLNGLIQYLENKWLNQGLSVSHIRVHELPAEALLHANFKDESIIRAIALVESADAVVIASPVYKAAYSGVLKVFLDLLPQSGLHDKVMLPLVIGGSIAHLLSIDYALKPVINALGGRNILGGVYAVDQWIEKLDNGQYGLTEDIKKRLDDSASQLSEELYWQEIRTREQLIKV